MPDQALPGPPLRVLVADDNPVVRAGLAALLDGHPDIQVAARASNGAEAVTAATRVAPDVVLLDVRMPGTDGLTALPSLAALAPVMMLTYSSEPEVVSQALRRGRRATSCTESSRGRTDHRGTRGWTWARLVTHRHGVRRRWPPSGCGGFARCFATNRTKSLRICNRLWHSCRSKTRPATRRRSPPRPQPTGLRPEFKGGGGHGSHRGRREQPADRRHLLHQREDRQEPHQPHLRKAAQYDTRSEAIARWLGTAREGWK